MDGSPCINEVLHLSHKMLKKCTQLTGLIFLLRKRLLYLRRIVMMPVS